MAMTKKEILGRFRDIGVIHKEPVKLRSGVTANFYCDIKKAYGYPNVLNALADEVGKSLTKDITCVAASGYGGLPLASLVAVKFNKKFIAVRSESKGYGRDGFIDGYIPNEKDNITIIDDVLTTGCSIKETYAILTETKGSIKNAIVVVKRGDAELPIPYSHLFTIDEIIND